MNSPPSPSVPSVRRVPELAAYGVIIVAAVLAKTLYTLPIELDGDALRKWEFAVNVLGGDAPADQAAPILIYGRHVVGWAIDLPAFILGPGWVAFWDFVPGLLDGPAQSGLTFDHHTARWAINLPTYAFIRAFGSSWFVYYVVPLFVFAVFLTISAAFFRAYSKFDLFCFLIFVIILFSNPLYARSTTQLQPFVFVTAYLMAHIIFVCILVRKYSLLYCFFAALFIFLAYGSKITALFYAPASAIFILWAMGLRNGIKAIVVISLFGAALIALETAVLSLYSREFVTRLHVMAIHAFQLDLRYSDLSVLDLFKGWTDISIYSAILFLLSAIIGAYFLVRNAGRRTIDPIVLLALLFFSFAAFETLLVKSIDPLTPITPPKAKYLADLVPWASMIVALALGRALWKLERTTPKRARGLAAASLLAVVLSGGMALASHHNPAAWMWRADREYAHIAEMMRAGTPIRGLGKVKLLGKIMAVPMVSIQGKGRLFWVYAGLDDPAETLLSGKCLDIDRLLRANLKKRRCLPR